MASDIDGKRTGRHLSRAEVYAIALRRAARGSAEALPHNESKQVPSTPDPAPEIEVSRPPSEAGWKKLDLPRSGSMTLADMRDVFTMAFTAVGGLRGAAMYGCEETESGWTVYFSPTAEKIFGSVMALKGAVDCDRPADYQMELLCGNPAECAASKGRIFRNRETYLFHFPVIHPTVSNGSGSRNVG